MPGRRRAAKEAQPHDAIVKWTFSQREHAIGLLKAALPPDLVRAVDWGSLRVEKDSFVDRSLRGRYSDVVLSARMGEGRIYFYALIEHQRKVDPLMVFRVLVYMVRLWERLVRDNPRLKALPPIVPLLIHGSDTGWTAATAFQDIIAGEGPARAALERHVPRFELRLVDVSPGRASHLVEEALTALGQVVLWALSVAGDDERLEAEIGRLSRALDEVLAAPDGLAALEALLRYLVATRARMRPAEVGKLLENTVGADAQEVIVDFVEAMKQEGRREGRREGKREGKREGRAQTLLDLLAARFGPVPADARARVEAADEPTLVKWTHRLLTAPTLDDVLHADAPPAKPSRRTAPRKPAPRRAPRKT